jgi:hypothetical protein
LFKWRDISRFHAVKPFLARLDETRALALDFLSFGLVNLLQARHPLPADFRERWDKFSAEWARRPVEEFYAVPADYIPPELPEHGRLRFPSPYPGNDLPNNTAAVDLFPCRHGWTAPTMLLAHGLMSVSDIGYRMWARRLNARGWNAVFVHLPYHYSRRIPWHFHGEYSIGGELMRSALGLRQAVTECRVVLRQLEKKGGRLFGGWGTSYDIDKAIWHSPSSVTIRAALRKTGLGPADTAPSMRLACPAKQKPLIDPHHVLMLAGQYDRIAPPEEIEELSKLWGGTHFACFPQGHVGYTLMPESFRLAQEIWADDFEAGPSFADPVASLVK